MNDGGLMVQATGLTKGFGSDLTRLEVVRDLDLTIGEAEGVEARAQPIAAGREPREGHRRVGRANSPDGLTRGFVEPLQKEYEALGP